jgi:hypothetical protein
MISGSGRRVPSRFANARATMPTASPFDGGADVARSGGSTFQCKRIENCKVFAVHQGPSHRFAPHHADRVAFARVTGKSLEHTSLGRVDHRRMDDDAFDFGR